MTSPERPTPKLSPEVCLAAANREQRKWELVVQITRLVPASGRAGIDPMKTLFGAVPRSHSGHPLMSALGDEGLVLEASLSNLRSGRLCS
jgi:hypothetical protein